MTTSSPGRSAAQSHGPAPVRSGPRGSRPWLWTGLLAAPLLCLGGVFWLLASGGQAEDSRSARRARIAQMSEVERARLERNLQQFVALPAEEQARLRALHEAIREDAARGGGLEGILASYDEWLKSLSPWQREELRRAESAQQRLRLVSEYKNLEKQNLTQRTGPGGPGAGERHGSRGWIRPSSLLPDLSQQDLTAIMQVVAEHLSRDQPLPPPLAEEPQYRRYRTLLLSLMQSGAVDDRLVARMIAAISSSEVREIAEVVPDSTSRRRFVMGVLMKGVGKLWQAEYEKRKPAPEVLEEFAAQIPSEEQQRLERFPEWERQRRITALWMEENEPEFYREYVSVPRFFGFYRRSNDDDDRRSRDGGRSGRPYSRDGRPRNGDASPDDNRKR